MMLFWRTAVVAYLSCIGSSTASAHHNSSNHLSIRNVKDPELAFELLVIRYPETDHPLFFYDLDGSLSTLDTFHEEFLSPRDKGDLVKRILTPEQVDAQVNLLSHTTRLLGVSVGGNKQLFWDHKLPFPEDLKGSIDAVGTDFMSMFGDKNKIKTAKKLKKDQINPEIRALFEAGRIQEALRLRRALIEWLNALGDGVESATWVSKYVQPTVETTPAGTTPSQGKPSRHKPQQGHSKEEQGTSKTIQGSGEAESSKLSQEQQLDHDKRKPSSNSGSKRESGTSENRFLKRDLLGGSSFENEHLFKRVLSRQQVKNKLKKLDSTTRAFTKEYKDRKGDVIGPALHHKITIEKLEQVTAVETRLHVPENERMKAETEREITELNAAGRKEAAEKLQKAMDTYFGELL